MPVVSKEENVFEHFADLPRELQMMLINSMPFNDSLKLGGNNEEISKTEFYSTNLVRYALQYFKTLLKIYRKTVQKLIIGEKNPTRTILTSFDYEIESLENLEELEIYINFQVSQIIQKLERPLKVLIYNEKQEIFALQRYEKIHQVRDVLFVPELKLNYEKFLTLSASQIKVHIGGITVKQIFNFIKLWQNGTLRDSFESCEWDLEGSSFNSARLFQLFGVEIENSRATVKIKHDKEPENFAELSVELLSHMRFTANIDDNQE